MGVWSDLPLSLPSDSRRRDKDRIVVAVVRVLVAPRGLTLALLSLWAPLSCWLRSPAAS